MPKIPTYPYPLPTAKDEHVQKVMDLYQERYGVTLTQERARELLETLMRLIYLTQLHDALHPLRQEIQ